jgi:protein-L-isoaspartate(D-aspartate) O-methyltransferase
VVKTADGTYGWQDEAPFDRVLVTAGAPAVPTPLFQQLAEGGRMVVPIGDPQSQTLHVVDKVDGQMRTSTDCGCVFVKLVGRYGWED